MFSFGSIATRLLVAFSAIATLSVVSYSYNQTGIVAFDRAGRSFNQQRQQLHNKATNIASRSLRLGSEPYQKDSPLRRGERSYSDYIGYHARDRNGVSESDRAFYGYPEDQATLPPSWLAKKYQETTLADVWICWVLAVGWTSWMLGSFVKSELLRYGQDSITVRGNVRLVTLDEASLGTGFPVYKAVIDYLVPAQLCYGRYGNHPQHPTNSVAQYPLASTAVHTSAAEWSDDDATTLPAVQIRKEFETLHPLEQGFGNVELLVLNHEPTTSIIKEDWEQQVMEEMEESRSRRGAKKNCCWCVHVCCRCLDGVFCGFGKDAYGEHLIWKRIWIAFCLLMMLVSMAGCVLAVHLLSESNRRLGWLCLCLQSLLVFPIAITIRLGLISVQRKIIPQGRAGFVVSHNPSFSSTPTVRNHGNQSHGGLAWGDASNNAAESKFCMDPSDVLDVQICEEDEVLSLQQTREQVQQQSDSEEYVVRLPGIGHKPSDVSEMSNNSHLVPLNTMSVSETEEEEELDVRGEEEDSDCSNRSTKGMVEAGVMA